MILSRYLARRLAMMFLLVFGVFAGMLVLLDMVEQVRRLSDQESGFLQVLRLALLNTPQTLYQITPLIVILASMAVFLSLSRTSELVVIRAAGRSVLRVMVLPILAVLAAGVAFVAVMNPLVASSSREYQRVLAQLRGDEVSAVVIRADGLWLRQALDGGQMVINATGASADGTVLRDVTFLIFASGIEDGGGVARRLHAHEARLGAGAWELFSAKDWNLGAANPEAEARSFARMRLPTDLTPSQIRDGFARPGAIPIRELPAFIAALERAGFSAREHRVWLQMELALPLMLVGMMLLAAGSSIHLARAGGAGLRALATILAGFALFFLRNFAQVLGENGQIPVLLAAWALPVATVLLALGLMLHMEDG